MSNLPSLPELFLIDWIATRTGEHCFALKTDREDAERAAKMLANAEPPMPSRITKIYTEGQADLMREALELVERWANYKSQKPRMTPQEVLSIIQHHPVIEDITRSYVDGVIPPTRNPWAELKEAQAKIDELERALGQMWLNSGLPD